MVDPDLTPIEVNVFAGQTVEVVFAGDLYTNTDGTAVTLTGTIETALEGTPDHIAFDNASRTLTIADTTTDVDVGVYMLNLRGTWTLTNPKTGNSHLSTPLPDISITL